MSYDGTISILDKDAQSIAEVSSRIATRELNELKEKDVLLSEGTSGRGELFTNLNNWSL